MKALNSASKNLARVNSLVCSSFNVKPHLFAAVRNFEESPDILAIANINDKERNELVSTFDLFGVKVPQVLLMKSKMAEMLKECSLKQKKAHENTLLIVLQETLKVNEDVINYFKERFNHVNGSPTIYPPKFDLEITIDEQEFGLHVDCFGEEYGTNFNIPCPVGKDSEEALLIVVDMLINKVWGLERSKGDIESCFGEKTVQVGMRYKRVPKFRSTFSVKEFQD